MTVLHGGFILSLLNHDAHCCTMTMHRGFHPSVLQGMQKSPCRGPTAWGHGTGQCCDSCWMLLVLLVGRNSFTR